MHTIDIESITGELGTYEVTWWIDEYVNNPFDEYDHLTSVVLGPRDRRSLAYSYGPMAESVSRILADGIHSEASVVRWLALRGCRSIHTLHHSGDDGRIAADPPFKPDTTMRSGALAGVAFIAPEFVSQVTDPDRVVRADIQELSYWAEGDAFGYSVTHRSGEAVGSGGGYFGCGPISRTRFCVTSFSITSRSTRAISFDKRRCSVPASSASSDRRLSDSSSHHRSLSPDLSRSFRPNKRGRELPVLSLPKSMDAHCAYSVAHGWMAVPAVAIIDRGPLGPIAACQACAEFHERVVSTS